MRRLYRGVRAVGIFVEAHAYSQNVRCVCRGIHADGAFVGLHVILPHYLVLEYVFWHVYIGSLALLMSEIMHSYLCLLPHGEEGPWCEPAYCSMETFTT